MELTEFSQQYYKHTEILHRHQFGQYFTIKSLRELALKDLPKIEGAKIAELGCGSGEFVDSILEHFPNCQIDAIEIDELLANYCLKKYNNVNVIHADVLDYQLQKEYDFVIGNPPYFEFKPSKKIRTEYQDVIGGRVNIYSLFIKKGIDALKNDGYLSFVVPTSMLSGSYFAKLRKYICKHCSIVNIIEKQSNHFLGANQNVMILVLKKCKNDGKFIFHHNDILIFTKEYKHLNEIYSNCCSLKDLGFEVRTGTLVWNQHKEKLSERESDILLVWAHNITNNGFVKSNKKPQFININIKPINQKVIITNRIAGNNSKLKSCILDETNFICENHVNVIYPKTNTITLEELLVHLQNPENIDIMKKVIGNTQISKNELEKLFPIRL